MKRTRLKQKDTRQISKHSTDFSMNTERKVSFILQFVSIRAKMREKYTNGPAEGRPMDNFPSNGWVDCCNLCCHLIMLGPRSTV